MKIATIKLNKIFPNSLQPRVEFDKEEIKGLANSIKEVGLINPIQVKKVDNSNGQYEIVCGERRFKAYQFLKLKEIDVIIKDYGKNKHNEMVESLVENLQRTDLSSVEKENYIYKLSKLKIFKTQKALAQSLGYSETYVCSLINAKEVRARLNIPNTISTRIINDISSLKDEYIKKIIKKIEKSGLCSRKIREYVQILNKSPNKDIVNSLFNNEISIKQAKNIIKIENPQLKKSVIKAHIELKKIDNSIERKIMKNKKNVKVNNVIKTNEVLIDLRTSILDLQNKNQSTLKYFLKCLVLKDYMDIKQVERLKYHKDLLESNLNNVLMVLEKVDNRIK